ncbi:helix-turn-helix domain-containing protein [Halioxenophilus sp. WMMB6]|uniref:helix-turn-helix domain-containing protein n=1 Tax=Halioxenophilus sp. WMMB6 TaxID=3073815 RepID=UPI00295EE84B|nr:helix-turn-helix domain-containing protein [Halioxenophilus sp. WMMB6]
MSLDVGQRLQLIRKINGWSQRQLARRAGVTNSAISQMEQGRISPSVASLKKVLDGVPISLADFFGLDLAASANAFYASSEMQNVGDGNIIAKLLAADKSSRKMSVTWEFYPPGADTGEVMLSVVGEKAGIVFDGQLEVTVGAESQLLGPGDGFYIETMRPHRIRNNSGMGCIAFSVTSEGKYPD